MPDEQNRNNGWPPSAAALAPLFGLEELCVGRHYLRDSSRARVGSVWLRYVWRAEILPSFDTPSVLCVARAKGEEFRKTTTRDWIKAVFVTADHSAVVEIKTDPVVGALNGIDLFLLDEELWLDGIGYNVSFETIRLKGVLQFANPMQGHLARLESAMFSLASEIASKSKVLEIDEFVRVWGRYINR